MVHEIFLLQMTYYEYDELISIIETVKKYFEKIKRKKYTISVTNIDNITNIIFP